MAESATSNEPVVLIKGGKGGRGNQHFATPTRRTRLQDIQSRDGSLRNTMLYLSLSLLLTSDLSVFPM